MDGQINHEWRTDDMALAAYIALEGGIDPAMHWEMESCYFVFHDGKELEAAVTEFVSGRARVEPRQYNMTFSRLKKAMFNDPHAPVRTR